MYMAASNRDEPVDPHSTEAKDHFAKRLLAWWDVHGRKDLPWQLNRTPYRVWVSEIMLQQTTVAAVVPYFERFMARFPDVETLADAGLDEVLHLWSGLGYYARARSLHRAAGIVVTDHGGRLPESQEALMALPGVGRSTAAAIAAQAFGRRAAILDGNVKRVLSRIHRVAGQPSSSATISVLWDLAEAHTPADRVADYTQAIMDLGATLCRRRDPSCPNCPVQDMCGAFAQGDIASFPERAVRRERRAERRRFFVLTAPDRTCYVEQRPNAGIWGGLWSPPERDADESVTRFLEALGVESVLVEQHNTAPTIHHGFTHFDLDVEPVYIHLVEKPPGLPGRWIGPDHRLGVSVVAAKLLAATQPLGLEP